MLRSPNMRHILAEAAPVRQPTNPAKGHDCGKGSGRSYALATRGGHPLRYLRDKHDPLEVEFLLE